MNEEGSPPQLALSRAADLRVWLLTVGLATASVLLMAHLLPTWTDITPELHIPWWVLLLLFCVAERAVVPVFVQRGTHSSYAFSLSEVPLVLGLILADPAAVIATRVVAGVLVMLVEGHRDLQKIAFNAAMFAFEVAAALLVYGLVLGGANPLGPRGWLALFAGMGAEVVAGTVLVPLVISMAEGRLRFESYLHMLSLAAVAGFANTTLGFLAVFAFIVDPRMSWILAAVALLLFLVYKGYTSLSDKHESLAMLHEFTQKNSRLLTEEAMIERLLRESMTLLRAAYAELVLLTGSEPGEALVVSVRKSPDAVTAVGRSLTYLPVQRRVIEGHLPLLAGRKERDPDVLAFLRQHGVEDAMLVPLNGQKGAIGTLCVGGRLGVGATFSEDDVRLCQTVANHASVLLENGRLVARLREEVADKEHQASHDALTGLPNRTMFHDRVQRAVLHARASGDRRVVAVMLLDLDRFKEVNDTLGHHVGDELLQEVGVRLRASVKAGDTVARLGGDEFAILLPSVRDQEEAKRVADRARAALEEPFEIGALTLVVGASLGIALAPEHGDLATVLLQRADVAMYAAKASHGGCVVYNPDVDTHSPRRLALVGDLRHAIESDGLDVHFQPKVDTATGVVVGAEALVRWHHPTEGFISPEDFIPIAERTGMIHDLTAQVLHKALVQCAAWRRSGRRIDVAVNVSASSLLNLEFPEDVRRLLAEASVAPSSLTLEITEGSIMADPVRSIRVLNALSATGVQLAIDDFGTGYSSLSQLKQLPVDELKIDKSFIMDMISDDDDATIVRSTIDLGHNLGLRLVAEGVENAETWRRLRMLGCDIIQGYFLSRALEPAAFERWLGEWERGMEQRILPPVDERPRSIPLDPSSLGPFVIGDFAG